MRAPRRAQELIEKLKAIAYPGGDRFKGYDECEQNEFAEGCA